MVHSAALSLKKTESADYVRSALALPFCLDGCVASLICSIPALADVTGELQHSQHKYWIALSDLGVKVCNQFPKENHLLSSALVL